MPPPSCPKCAEPEGPMVREEYFVLRRDGTERQYWTCDLCGHVWTVILTDPRVRG